MATAPDMGWSPISEDDLRDLITQAECRMSPLVANLWKMVQLMPEKWSEPNYGRSGGGFWVVAVIGKTAVWYNDIEEGFNRSRYTSFGVLDEYRCNQDELEMTLLQLLDALETGVDNSLQLGPPIPCEYPR